MTALRKPVLVLAPVAALVVALSFFTNVFPFREIMAQRQEIATAQARLESLQTANATLERQVAALHTPLAIERLAREQLGYVRPGEQAFVVIEPEPATITEDLVSQQLEVAAEEQRPWYLELWDYLTGRDLMAR